MFKVSVIIPVYQAENYIRACVSSVLEQTYNNVEIILVDDGSTDNSAEICDELSDKDEKIKVIHQRNGGVSSARNRGLKEAKGDYVLFVDSDDLIEKEMIKCMLDKASIYGADVLMCGFDYVYRDRVEVQVPKEEGAYSVKYIYSNFWEFYRLGILHNIGTKLYSRKLLNQYDIRFDEKKTVLEDIQFCMDALNKSESIYICDSDFYKYRMEVNHFSIQKTYRRDYYKNLQEFFWFIERSGVEKNKDFYLVYMDAILLALVNELYKDKKKVSMVLKEYKNICNLDYTIQSRKYVMRGDVRFVKYLFYQAIWRQKTFILFLMISVWYLKG